MTGRIDIVGLGPGSTDWLAPAVYQAIESAGVILGYHTYLEQIEAIAPTTPREASGMRHEVERARRAIELAQRGEQVMVVSGGDPGIYGMAGLVLEMLNEQEADIPVTVMPGISALNAAAALLGAPLMTDFATVSLSDHLMALDDILLRVEAAARAGFVLCLYNPRSHKRTEPFERTCQVLLQYLPAQTPVGVVQAAFRPNQSVRCIALEDLPTLPVGMDTILIVGRSTTRIMNDKMVTPRGYQKKYDLRDPS